MTVEAYAAFTARDSEAAAGGPSEQARRGGEGQRET